MNTNASKSNLTFYKNTGHEKRNHYNNDQSARFYKNSETDRRIIAPSMSGNYASQDAAVASVIKLFKGTIVSLDAGSVECHCREIFS
jgi:hypothetical protein